MDIIDTIVMGIFFSAGLLFFYHIVRGIILILKKRGAEAEFKASVLFFATAAVMAVVGALLPESEPIEATTTVVEPQYPQITGELNDLDAEQIKAINTEVIPLATDFLEYESVRVYKDPRVGYGLSFVITPESFGTTYSENKGATVAPFYEINDLIHKEIKAASLKLDSIIRQPDGVTMEFALPTMESSLIMKVRGGEVIYTEFEK